MTEVDSRHEALDRYLAPGYADNERVGDDLTAAGFTDAICTVVELRYVVASARDAAPGYCLGTALRTELQAGSPAELAPVVEAATAALRQRFGSGPIETTMRAHIVAAG